MAKSFRDDWVRTDSRMHPVCYEKYVGYLAFRVMYVEAIYIALF